METGKRSFLLGLCLVLLMAIPSSLYAEESRASAKVLNEASIALPSVPDKNHLLLVSFLPVVSGTQIIADVALYDDAATKRPADYLELYDTTGLLLAVSWFDRLGIRRTAVDRGLLQDGRPVVEGILVLLPEGTLV